ncbi:MAG: hypothetical protein AAGJ46_07540 [Planctomycetota bacterium]
MRFAFAAALLSALPCHAVWAGDLRIETVVTSVEDEATVSQSITCFRDGVVYDFRPKQERVTVYQAARPGRPARFLLLDTAGKRQTEIKESQVAATIDKLRRWAASQEDPFLRFTGEPEFDESFDPDTGELLMASEQLTYRLTTQPIKDASLKTEVRSFLDAFAKLQTLLDAGLPPEPRLLVNEALFRHEVIPAQIELTARDDEEPSLRATHDVAWVLSKQDLLRIDVAIDQLASFQKVSNAEFQEARLRAAANRSASPK